MDEWIVGSLITYPLIHLSPRIRFFVRINPQRPQPGSQALSSLGFHLRARSFTFHRLKQFPNLKKGAAIRISQRQPFGSEFELDSQARTPPTVHLRNGLKLTPRTLIDQRIFTPE